MIYKIYKCVFFFFALFLISCSSDGVELSEEDVNNKKEDLFVLKKLKSIRILSDNDIEVSLESQFFPKLPGKNLFETTNLLFDEGIHISFSSSFLNNDTNTTLTKEYYYEKEIVNENHLKLSKYNISDDELIGWISFYKDNDGRIIEQIIDLGEFSEIEYWSNGLVKSKKGFIYTSFHTYITEYSYHFNGRLKSKRSKLNLFNGLIYYPVRSIKQDDKGNSIETTDIGWLGHSILGIKVKQIKNLYQNEYNSKDQLIKSTYKKIDSLHTYDTDEIPLDTIVVFLGQGEVDYKYTNNLISSSSNVYSIDGINYNKSNEINYEYNLDKKLILSKSLSYDENGSLTSEYLRNYKYSDAKLLEDVYEEILYRGNYKNSTYAKYTFDYNNNDLVDNIRRVSEFINTLSPSDNSYHETLIDFTYEE